MNKKFAITAALVIAALVVAAVAWRLIAGEASPLRPAMAGGRAEAPKEERAYFTLASDCEAKQDFVKARETYQKFIEKFPASNGIIKAQERIDNCNVMILFSSAITPGSELYEVQKGDNLTKIARKFNTTVELLAKSNNIHGSAIRLGRKLKVPKLKFSIVVDKSQKILMLKAGGEIFKTYKVATGKDSKPTPVGTFTVTSKIVDPPWYQLNGKMIPAGDPANQLGSRWLGLSKPSYGIHGTIDPSSIGQDATEGCVRMKNSDVEELFSIVPEGTEVVIVE